MSKALGGPEETGKSNPEELFAAGWGACFQSSMYVSAASLGIKFPTGVDDSIVETTVHLVGDAKKLDMGMRVDMDVRVRGMEKEDFDKVISKAREMCPYIRATNGNVEVKFNASQL